MWGLTMQSECRAYRRLGARYPSRRRPLNVAPRTARHLRDDLELSADRTGKPDALAAGRGKHPGGTGTGLPVPRQARPPCRTAFRKEKDSLRPRRQNSNTPPDRQPRLPGACYLYCMISPIRGNFPSMGVQVPPRTHMQLSDLGLSACRYRTGKMRRRSQPWGVQVPLGHTPTHMIEGRVGLLPRPASSFRS
jgi:hypothetical protein